MLNQRIDALGVSTNVGALGRSSDVHLTSEPHGDYVVSVQVSIPANNLAGVALNSRAQVSVAQGFAAPEFTVTVNGSGDVYALGVSTEALTVNLRG